MPTDNIASSKICSSFCFCRYGLSVPKAQEALEYYSANKKSVAEWQSKESTTPIFIDTNVLLKLYKISKDNRTEMLTFLQQNKDRIYICGQVGQEYLKHRCSEIKHYASTITNLQAEIKALIEKIKGVQVKSSLGSLLNNDILQDDMPQSYEILRDIIALYNDTIRPLESTELFDRLNNVVGEEGTSLISDFQYEYDDPILKVVASLKHLNGLSPEEDSYTKKLYDILLSEYKENKSNEDFSFPGSGDNKKLKYSRPAHGDLTIFHEMLQFIKAVNTDSIFVTLDVTKGDWLRHDGSPFIHYIYSIFNLTGHMIYICSEKDFPMSFDSISGEKDKDEHADDDIEEIFVPEQEDSAELNESPIVENCPTKSTETSQEPSNNVSEGASLDEVGGLTTAQTTKRYTSSGYREIDPDAFIFELKMAIDWAKNYGAGYVNKYLFVSKILRNHHYDIRSAFKVMNQLISDRKIIVKKETHNGRNMDCLEIMPTDIIPTSE